MSEDGKSPDAFRSAPNSLHPTYSHWSDPWSVTRFAGTAAIGVLADLSVKAWAYSALNVIDDDGQRRVVTVIPGWLEFCYTGNHGAAMGFFQGYRGMFLLVSAAAIVFLAYLFSISRTGQRGYQFILGLLLAGVLGNFYDRAAFGYVRDMIHIFPGRRWPEGIAQHLPPFWSTPEWFPWIFNLADSYLCLGVGLMLIYGFFFDHNHKPAANAPAKEMS